LLLNSEVNKTFYSQLLKKGYIRSEEMEPSPVSRLTISKITGRLPAVNTPEDFLVSTLAFSKNIPTDMPDTYKEFFVDTTCGALASPLTPEDQKRFGYSMTPLSITPYDIDAIRTRYTPKSGMVLPPYNIYMAKPATYCPGRETTATEDITLTTSLTDNIQIQKNLTLSYTASLSG
jgi:hypothetical protein